MVINAGMRTLSGIILRSSEIARFEHTSTSVAERPIPMPFIAAVVTANVGQVPSTSRRVGFSLMSPFVKQPKYLFFICGRLLYLFKIIERLIYRAGHGG